jgi:excisionase family DNA binding protein
VGEGQDPTGHSSGQRASVREAAELLGTTVDAIRKRVQRGTIPYEKVPDGRVWILLDTVQDSTGHRQDTDRPQSDSGALISEMRARIESLERQLEQERQANSEHRRLLAAALERIPPQLEAPSEAGESDVSPGPTDELGEVRAELGAERARREMAESTLHEGMEAEARRREEAERERDYLRRELYARRRPPEAPETVEEQQGRGQPHPATVESQEGVQRPQGRSWWRRMFGG